MDASSYAERVFVSRIRNPDINRMALRALRKANQLLGLVIGLRLAELRDSPEPLQTCYSKVEENALHARLLHVALDILSARWEKIPDR